jgi:hypothetical protein
MLSTPGIAPSQSAFLEKFACGLRKTRRSVALDNAVAAVA